MENDADFELSSPSKKTREDSYEKRRDVEALYADGVWYKSWLSSLYWKMDRPILFYDDNKAIEVDFPDKEVRLTLYLTNDYTNFQTDNFV